MKNEFEYFFDYADAEFSGKAFNGPSLIDTLRSLSMEQAVSEDTWEGYSIWEIVLHILYCKYLVAENLGITEKIGPYPYVKKDFSGLPDDCSEKAWRNLLSYLERVHKTVLEALRALDLDALNKEMPEWHIPYGQGISWFITHDAYHSAQIRNMGVSGLKSEKIRK